MAMTTQIDTRPIGRRARRPIKRSEAHSQPDGMTFADPALEDFASAVSLPAPRLVLWIASSGLAAARRFIADRLEID